MNRRPLHLRGAAIFACAVALSACVGSTGSALVSFDAYAAGPEGATGGPLTFTSGRAFKVTLTRANLRVGAIYLNRSVPISGGQELSCVAPGTYVAEVLSGLVVDTLSAERQAFPVAASGTADPVASGEVWLTGGDVTATDDATLIVDAAGTAEKDAVAYRFEARLTIGKNRAIPPTDPARPGANPLCKQRIVSPIAASLVPRQGGELTLRIDPRGWFANVDFAELAKDAGGVYRFADASEGQPNVSLYKGVHASQGVYSFAWSE